MDSFEARLQFIQILKNLQKSLNILRTGTDGDPRSDSPSLSRSAGPDPIQFYLKNYRQHYEDFHQCLFDTMSKMDPLDRVNIVMYYSRIMFILKSRESDFNTTVLNQHLLPSVDKMLLSALPVNDWTSISNLKSCIEVFQWLNKVCNDVVQWDDEPIKSDNGLPLSELQWFEITSDSTSVSQSFQNAMLLLKDRLSKQQCLFEYYRTNGICNIPTATTSPTILHRMENEREKHKRHKETNWVLERPSGSIVDEQEFENLWSSAPNNGMTKHDYRNIKELNRIAKQSYVVGPQQ